MKLASWGLSAVDPICPNDLQLFSKDQVYACGIPEGSPIGCLSLPLFSSPVAHNTVCGKVTGYQKSSIDALNAVFFASPTINDPYVDGVSITRGTPRQHVWSYVLGKAADLDIACPCSILGILFLQHLWVLTTSVNLGAQLVVMALPSMLLTPCGMAMQGK